MYSIPRAGEVLGGKYRVLKVLDEGGMGVVLEAEHLITQGSVAIKWMRPEIAENADAQARLIREAQASARVRHPNIVDVYDVVREGSTFFLVMELLRGETLREFLKRGGTPLHKLIELLLPALRAVAAAHRQGVIHRDLKPENIFLCRQADREDPVLKLLDFGISKVTGASGPTITSTGAAMGTPMYMSLEQLSNVPDLDARTDVYALGVILYEAVTGRAPFEAETFSELAIKVATVEPPGPKQLRSELPTALASLIGRAMAKQRENRVASVEELVRALEPFASERSFRAKMTHQGGALPAVRGESQPPSAPPTATTVARAVEAAPSYARAAASSAPRASGMSPRRGAALALTVVAVLAGGSWALMTIDADPSASPQAARPPPHPSEVAPAGLVPSEPRAAENLHTAANADAAILTSPNAAPLAPKAQRPVTSPVSSSPHRPRTESRAGGTRLNATSEGPRAGKARMEDFLSR